MILPVPLLHSGVPVSWHAWIFDPPLLLLSVAGVTAYVWKTQQLDPPVPVRYWLSFFAGTFVTLIALVSPLDAASGQMLSFHMLQHVLLSSVAAPLLVLGLPAGLARELVSDRRVLPLTRILLSPVITAPLFILNMWVWHLPPVYELALYHRDVHEIMHLTFLGTGILFWWPILQEVPGRGTLSMPAKMLYLFVSGFPMELLALLFIASPDVIYAYYNLPPYLLGLSPIPDQQVAGVIMGAVGEAAGFIAISVFFFRLGDEDVEGVFTPVAKLGIRKPLTSSGGWLLVGSFALFIGTIIGISARGGIR